MYLIIKHQQDEYGLTPPATHKHIADYKKAMAEFKRLTETGTHCTLLMDAEYRKLYALDAQAGQA